MTCQRFESLLLDYLEQTIASEDLIEVEKHLKGCSRCAELAGLMRCEVEILRTMPEVEPGNELIGRLLAIPDKQSQQKFSIFRFLTGFFNQPAWQPVLATLTVFMIMISFLTQHPRGRSFQKEISRMVHSGYSQVERLYARTGQVTYNVESLASSVFSSIKTLAPVKARVETK